LRGQGRVARARKARGDCAKERSCSALRTAAVRGMAAATATAGQSARKHRPGKNLMHRKSGKTSKNQQRRRWRVNSAVNPDAECERASLGRGRPPDEALFNKQRVRNRRREDREPERVILQLRQRMMPRRGKRNQRGRCNRFEKTGARRVSRNQASIRGGTIVGVFIN